jgi:hypothetical protein
LFIILFKLQLPLKEIEPPILYMLLIFLPLDQCLIASQAISLLNNLVGQYSNSLINNLV